LDFKSTNTSSLVGLPNYPLKSRTMSIGSNDNIFIPGTTLHLKYETELPIISELSLSLTIDGVDAGDVEGVTISPSSPLF